MNIEDIYFSFLLGHCSVLFVSEYLTGTYHGDFSREQKKTAMTSKRPAREYFYIHIDRQYMNSAK